MSNPLLSVLVVTYRSQETIGACLDSVRGSLTGIDWEAVVLDNASPDQTQQTTPRDSRIQVVPSPTNLGFARGCNHAAALARGEFFLLLNPDARLLNFPRQLIETFLKDPRLGAVGPWIDDSSRGDVSWRRRRFEARLPTIAGEIVRWGEFGSVFVFPWLDLLSRFSTPPDRLEVGWLTGAAILIPAPVFRSVAGFDERFFLYWEDVDLGWRLRAQGYRLEIWRDWKLVHHAGYQRHHRSRELFVEKNRGQRLMYEKIWGRVPPSIDLVRRVADEFKNLWPDRERRKEGRRVWEDSKPKPDEGGSRR